MTEMKVAFVGETAVGKTSILQSFVTGKFNFGAVSTSAASFLKKSLDIDGQIIKFQIWDTAGQEKFRAMSAMYYRAAPFVVCVFDVNRRQTFDDLKSFWINEIQSKGLPNVSIVICGNKVDLEGRAVFQKEAEEYAKTINAPYCECSAKTQVGVVELFKTVGR